MGVHTSYLDLTYLPEVDGYTETVGSFGLRVLQSNVAGVEVTSRDGGNNVAKQITLGGLKIIAGSNLYEDHKDRVLSFLEVENKSKGIQVNVAQRGFFLVGKDLGNYSGATNHEWLISSPSRLQPILEHTKRLLGELGLHSGIEL